MTCSAPMNSCATRERRAALHQPRTGRDAAFRPFGGRAQLRLRFARLVDRAQFVVVQAHIRRPRLRPIRQEHIVERSLAARFETIIRRHRIGRRLDTRTQRHDAWFGCFGVVLFGLGLFRRHASIPASRRASTPVDGPVTCQFRRGRSADRGCGLEHRGRRATCWLARLSQSPSAWGLFADCRAAFG